MTTIIKQRGATGVSESVRCAAFNLDDLAEHAKDYLAEVRRQADAILNEARAEAAEVRRQAAEQGRADALQTAQKNAADRAGQDLEQRLQTVLPALSAATAEIQQCRAAWRKHWEEHAVHLAVAIAGRVCRREIQRTPKIGLDLVQEALELAAGAGRIVLRLSPRDFEALGRQVQAMATQLGRSFPTEIVSDPTVSPGGCLVTNDLGEIDQRLESQLARIEEELTG